MSVTEIKSKAQFNELVKSGSGVALQAHAQWCGPCRAISPIFNKYAQVNTDNSVIFARFDTDDVPDLAQELGITNIPAFYFFKHGELSDNLRGANPQTLQKAIENLSC